VTATAARAAVLVAALAATARAAEDPDGGAVDAAVPPAVNADAGAAAGAPPATTTTADGGAAPNGSSPRGALRERVRRRALPSAGNGTPVTEAVPPAPGEPPEPETTLPPPPGDEPKGTWQLPHYDHGFVLVSTPDESPLPYRLVLNHVSQFKYSNTLAVRATYTTHLGEVKEVQKRNDFQLTRDVFYFSGYVFDRRLDYNIITYTSTADLTAAAAGYVGFVFHKAFALRAGFFSLPTLRAMTGTYPYFAGTDRSMAENYMRPGFTQGVWANGELFPGFNYIAMVGNSLNTLNIAASRIDYRFAYSGSVWYDVNDFGKAWSDYEYHLEPALRLGTAFTYAREDRLSDLDTANPENNSTYMSDGTLLFGTGTLAPNVTVSLASFYLWAIDVGAKLRGFALNAEFYQRWLDNFVADGPLPLNKMYDWGFEASLGYFVVRRRLETYARTSLVQGPFGTGVEEAGGVHFFPFPTRQVWLSLEVIGIHHCPYTSVLYIYNSGQTGVLVPAQFLLRF
jgi:hypothetical protein